MEGKGHATERKSNKYKINASGSFLKTGKREENFLLWIRKNLTDSEFSLFLAIEEMAPFRGNQMHVFGRGASCPREILPLFVGNTGVD